jgi:Tol biopolymer transport system component
MLRKSRRIPVWVAISLTVLAVTGLTAWRFWPKPSKPAVSAPVPLTTYRGNEDAPSFSPDGNQVAFQWDGEKQDNLDIYVKTLGPDATPLRLTNNPLPDRLPSWSPDGRTIAFLRVPAPGSETDPLPNQHRMSKGRRVWIVGWRDCFRIADDTIF